MTDLPAQRLGDGLQQLLGRALDRLSLGQHAGHAVVHGEARGVALARGAQAGDRDRQRATTTTAIPR